MSIVDDMLEDAAENRELEKLNAGFFKARKEQAEEILKDIACFDPTSETSIENISKRARDYFKPKCEEVDIVDFS